MNYPRSIAFAVLWLMLSQAPAVAQDFEKGLAAARAGDFAVAVAEWRPLANDGHVEAQFNLGAIYEAGLGVPEAVTEILSKLQCDGSWRSSNSKAEVGPVAVTVNEYCV